MMIRPGRFNTYLLLATLLLAVVGCQSADSAKKKELSTLRVHLEADSTSVPQDQAVPVFRENPVLFRIEKRPFLTEANVKSAKLVDVMGGFAVQLELDHTGLFLLEEYTTANKGKHMIIFSQFGKSPDQSRWLAAPVIRQRIATGVLTFTPDASREEAEGIVRGLNNAIAKSKKNSWM